MQAVGALVLRRADQPVDGIRDEVAMRQHHALGHARGAAAVRESKKDRNASLETSVGVLAIHLGLPLNNVLTKLVTVAKSIEE